VNRDPSPAKAKMMPPQRSPITKSLKLSPEYLVPKGDTMRDLGLESENKDYTAYELAVNFFKFLEHLARDTRRIPWKRE
jgi:hypothetical protein